jgi:hypothetical protein
MASRQPLRGLSTAILAVALACIVVAPGAAIARPTPLIPPARAKLLPKRSCKGLLTTADFPGAVREGPGPPGFFDEPGSFVSVCGFYPAEPEPTEAEPEPPALKGGGEDALGVFPRAFYEIGGKTRNFVTPLIHRIDTSENTVRQLHGIGTVAYLVIDEEGNGTGIMQVRNDLFEVLQEGAARIPGLLANVARELEPHHR